MRVWIRLLLIAVLLLLAACRQSAQSTPTPAATAQEDDLEIEMAVEPTPLTVGDAVLVVSLRTSAGEAVEGATVAVHGDMNHAGMAPVLAESSASSDGVHRIPFRWSMGGDWIVTVVVTLMDGREVTRTFEMSVAS
jgi:ABC-type transport system substrate-binding protein